MTERTYAPREVAHRVFSAEFSECDVEHQEDHEYAPNFLVSPLGTLINRVLVMGVVTSVENVGENLDSWRAQIADPTGVFHVYAGSAYQPEAAKVLSELEPPTIVAVVGKARSYSPEEGVVYTSIRPETIAVVDVAQRDQWILEAAENTIERLGLMKQALELQDPSQEDIQEAMDVSERIAKGIALRLGHGRPEIGKLANQLQDALSYLVPEVGEAPRVVAAPAGGGSVVSEAPAPGSDTAAPAPASSTTGAPGAAPAGNTPGTQADPNAAETGEEEMDLSEAVLQLVEDQDTGDGTPWEDLVEKVSTLGVDEDGLEEVVNDLMDQGRLYEPVLGRLKIP